MLFRSLWISFVLCVPYMTCIDEWTNCSFENSWCKWRKDVMGDSNWTMAIPSWPFYKAPHGRYYLYANTTGLRRGAKAVLESPQFGINGVVCMKFRINALVETPGNLLIKSLSEQENTLHLTMDSFTERYWQCVYLSLKVTERTKLSIEMVETGSKVAIIGLDWIQFVEPSLCKEVCSNFDIDVLDYRFTNSSNDKEPKPSRDPKEGPLPVQTTLQMEEPTMAQVQSDMMTLLPAYIAVPVCFVVAIVILLIWYFRYFQKKQKEKAKKKQESVLSQLPSKGGNKDPTPLTEEDEYDYVTMTSANPYEHNYSTLKESTDAVITQNSFVAKSPYSHYTGYMEPRDQTPNQYEKPINKCKERDHKPDQEEPLDDKIRPSYPDKSGNMIPSKRDNNTYLSPFDDKSVSPGHNDYVKPFEPSHTNIVEYVKPTDQKPELPSPRQVEYVKPTDQKSELPSPKQADYVKPTDQKSELPSPKQADYVKPTDQKPELPSPRQVSYVKPTDQGKLTM